MIFFLAVLLSFAGVGQAQNRVPAIRPVSQPGPTNFHSLTLTVLDAATGQPVTGAHAFASFLVRDSNSFGEPEQPTTDARGLMVLRLVPLPDGMQNIQVSVQHSNYSARDLVCSAPNGRVRDLVPTNYTVKLLRGVTVGGFVRDERGQPVPAAKVLVWGVSSENNGPNAKAGVSDVPSMARNEAAAALTGANGFWTFSRFPPDLMSVWVEVTRPGGARTRFAAQNQMRNYGQNFGEVQVDALLSTNATLVLAEGASVRGMVVDEAGQAIGGVRFRERSGQPMAYQPYLFTNGADGRFELPHRTSARTLLTAEKEGYAIKSATLPPGGPEERIVLTKPNPLRVRVVDERDEPVADAQLQTQEWRNRGHLANWSARTDDQGRAQWTNAPLGTIVVSIAANSFPFRTARLPARDTENVVRLRRGTQQAINVQVKAVDDKTGQPVTNFEVLKDQQGMQRFESWGKAGDNGVFKSELARAQYQYRLALRADGYALWTDVFFSDEGDLDFTVRLTKARPPGGVVLRPDGQPAANAKVLLNTSESAVYSYQPGDFSSQWQGVETVRTPADGTFRFGSAAPQNRIIATHAVGFASLAVKDLSESGQVKLQPWGRLEGSLNYGGKPEPNQTVAVKYPLSWASLESHHLVYNSRTDKQGRFVFTNLPPGEYALYRMPMVFNGRPTTESHRQAVVVRPSQTTKVDYGFGGRTVTGQILADGTVDWKNDPHVLLAKQGPAPREPAYGDYADVSEYNEARRAFARSAAALEYERKRQQFLLLFDNDGNFQATDVPPGSYELRIRVTKPQRDNSRRFGNEEELASLTKDVTIPAGQPATEFDLGSFELPLKIPELQRGPPIALQAVTLEGKRFDLAELRGKPVLLIFWGQWAPKSAEQLTNLRQAVESLGPNPRVTPVTVNLDEDPNAARRGVQDFGKEWVHLRLEGAARVNVTEQLNIDTLPVIFLLNQEGAVAQREIGTKRLSALLDRLARQTAQK